MSSTEQKLSDFLAQVLITPSMRPGRKGICELVHEWMRFDVQRLTLALEACTQTQVTGYPVAAPATALGERSLMLTAFYAAKRNNALWRGEYGRNRRKLLRDCIRWLRSQGL